MVQAIISGRGLARLTSVLLLVAGAGWLAAQAPRPGTKEEIEDPRPPRARPPFRVGDEGSELPSLPLAQEALQAKHPRIKELLQQLSAPHDRVAYAGRTLTVQPIGPFLGSKKVEGELRLIATDLSGKAGQPLTVKAADLNRFEPYERIALQQVDQFLKGEPPPSRAERVQAGERVLAAVVAFHEKARERGVRTGPGWDEVGKELRSRLETVQLEWLDLLTAERDWPAVAQLTRRLAESGALPVASQVKVLQARLQQVGDQLTSDQDLDAAGALAQVEDELRERKEGPFQALREQAAGLRQKLRGRAEEILRDARRRKDQNDRPGALALWRKARELDKETPGLEEFRRELAQSQPQVLQVGVRQLPRNFTPATAVTDVERQVLDLLFEGLVRPITDPRTGHQHYEPVLAQDLPRHLPLERQFQLRSGARWSDGRPVTAGDINGTVELLRNPGRPGFVPQWAELVKPVHFINQTQVSLNLSRGYLDPLSLMTFKILPASRRLEEAAFAKQPVGSGPFYLPPSKAAEPGAVTLKANPYYGQRAGQENLPLLDSVRLFRSDLPVSEFQNGLLHLLLNASPKQMVELHDARLRLPYVELKTLRQRRVYFLAVNHRAPALQNQDLRRAIAEAIDREEILNKHFRAGLGPQVHRGLTGPYPPGSWASNPSLEKQAWSPDRARTLVKNVPLIAGQKLELKYPDGAPEVEAACQEIRRQVMENLDNRLEMVLKKLSPQAFRQEVEQEQTFELAYCSWDYPDESYWLWPLFDPHALQPGGRNFMSYVDGDLQRRFQQAMAHRAFGEVQKLTHQIHQDFYDKMPLIPLWQLDRHVAIHHDVLRVLNGRGNGEGAVPLGGTAIDPQAIFAGAETWKLPDGRP